MATTHVNSGIRLTVQQSTRLRKLSVELGMSRNAIIGALIENAEVKPVIKMEPVSQLNANSRNTKTLAGERVAAASA